MQFSLKLHGIQLILQKDESSRVHLNTNHFFIAQDMLVIKSNMTDNTHAGSILESSKCQEQPLTLARHPFKFDIFGSHLNLHSHAILSRLLLALEFAFPSNSVESLACMRVCIPMKFSHVSPSLLYLYSNIMLSHLFCSHFNLHSDGIFQVKKSLQRMRSTQSKDVLHGFKAIKFHLRQSCASA